MAIFWDWKPRFEDVKVLYLGSSVEVPRVIDQYAWDSVPKGLNLGYYDIVVLNLNALAGTTLNAQSYSSLPSQKELTKFIFQGPKEIIALGNPLTRFSVTKGNETEGHPVTWWLPGVPSWFESKQTELKSSEKQFKFFFETVQESDWHTDTKFVFQADLTDTLLAIHPLAESFGYSKKVLATSKEGNCVSISVSFSLNRSDDHQKEAGPVYWYPLPITVSNDELSSLLRKRFRKLIQSAPAYLLR